MQVSLFSSVSWFTGSTVQYLVTNGMKHEPTDSCKLLTVLLEYINAKWSATEEKNWLGLCLTITHLNYIYISVFVAGDKLT